MKKTLLLVIFVGLVFAVSAQGYKDGFFSSNTENTTRYIDPTTNQVLPNLPEYGGGDQSAEDAPLGTGLFLLTALGAGYAVSKRRKEAR